MKSLKLQLLAAIFMVAGLSSPAWAATVLSFGQTASGTISLSSQVDSYTFTASADDVVIITVADTDYSLHPQIQLYDPSLNLLGSAPGNSNNKGTLISSPLPTTGTYTVKVSSWTGASTGGYDLYIQRTNNPSGAANFVFGSAPASLINLPAQSDTYTFSATAGQSIYLAMTTTSGATMSPAAKIFSPSGSQLISQQSDVSCVGKSLALSSITLPTTGTYTMVLSACDSISAGNYSVYMQLQENPIGATPVFWGQTQSTYLASAAASNTFSFVGTSGNSIGLTATETGGAIRPVIRLYKPDGSFAVQAPASGCAAATSVALTSVTLTQDGTYTVLVGDCGLTAIGTYSLTSICAGSCPVTPKITWAAPAAITYPAALSSTQLNAVASVPNETVTGTYVYSPALGSIPHGGSDTLTVTFTPDDTGLYTIATASVPLTVYRVKPTLTWAPPAAIMYGTALSSTQLDATASVAGTTFVYQPGLGAQLPGGVQTLSVTFNAADSVDYAPVSTSVSITVDENATLTSPSPGGTLAGSSQTFEWTAGYGATAYIFHLGTTSPGSSDIYNSSSTTAQSAVISNIPTSGVILYARLYSEIGGVWRFADFTYTEAGSSAAPALISPPPGNTLTGSSATFTWSAGSGVSLYMLWLGTKGQGANDLYNSGIVKTTTTSATVTGIPVQGATLYARLFAELNGSWQYFDYTYTEVGTSAAAALTSPTPSTTLTSAATQTFYWSPGSGCTDYMLWVGTKGVGSNDLLNSGITLANSAVVTGITSSGATLYARLFSKLNGSWVDTDYTYTEFGTPAPSAITAPSPLSTLTNASQTFTWSTGTGVAANMLWLGTNGVGSQDLLNSGITTAHTTGALTIPTNGATVYARLFSEISGVWHTVDTTFTEYGTPVRSVPTAPAASSTLTNANQIFTWSTGTGVAANMLWLGTKNVGSNDFYNSGVTTAHATVALAVPANGATLYARLFSEISGVWQYTDYTYTEYGTPAKAALNSPTPGDTLSGTNVTFTWTNGVGVTSYMLQLGSTVAGSSDLYNPGVTSLTTASVTGLPTLGLTIHARLYSKVSGIWQYTDYTYIESGSSSQATLTSPTGGSTLSSASINFSWTAGTGVTAYQLLVGSTGIGSSNVFNSGSITATSENSVPVPATGAKLYIRLSSKIGGIWQSTDYSCTQSGTITPAVLSTPSPNSQLASGTVTFYGRRSTA